MKYRPDDVRIALEWALVAIKAMPAEQVPHNLRKIRGSSDRRLTRLHERTIYRELDKNPLLRETTLEILATAVPEEVVSKEEDPRLQLSHLFLTRPQGWEEDAGHLLTEAHLEDSRDKAANLQKELDGARGEIGKLKKQVKEVRRSAAAQSRRATRQLRETLERTKKRNRKLEGELSRRRQDNRGLEKELEAAFDELTLVDARVEELRKLVGKERSAASSFSPSTGGNRRDGWNRDPLKAARMLDQMVRFWEVGSDVRIERVSSPVRLEIPTGMDPKSSEAVQWLYNDAPRLTLIVDGWNVAFHRVYRLCGMNTDRRPDRKTMEFVTNKLDKLARYSIGEHRVRFYLDSEHANGLSLDWDSRFKSGHLTGFYVEDADDAIVAEAIGRGGEPVVVITSDNGLAERCEEHGAVRVYSEALAEWMASSPV